MRGLIFDLDDTLYPRERYVRSGLAAVAQHVESHYGIPSDLAFTEMLKAEDSRLAFQALGAAFDLPVDVNTELVAVFRNHSPMLWLFHDADAILRELRQRGWALAVLTNGLPSVQAAKVAALGLHELVDHVIYAAEHCPEGKPNPAAFHEALRRLELPAHQVVMVGDDAVCDIDGARAVGLRTIRIARHENYEPAAADIVLKTLGEVPRAAEALIPQVIAHAG